MPAWWLRAIFLWDRFRFALFRARLGGQLDVAPGASPNLRLAEVRLAPDARLEVAAGFAADRRAGHRIWLQERARLRIGERAWLRAEHAGNVLHVYPGAEIEIGADALLNGCTMVAKRSISIGPGAIVAFGARIFDADLHDLDRDTPERIEPVRIGARVWIGADVIVLRGVTIGDDTIVGAGSIVTRDLPARCIALGAPARPVRQIASREGCR
jgi:acetyltransferase-like isoleucine patch superfamily enzyme